MNDTNPPTGDTLLIKVTTESGSVYEIDPAQRRYRKAHTVPTSWVDEFEFRPYSCVSTVRRGRPHPVEPDAVVVGDQLLVDEPSGYWVRTSPVVSVEEVTA